MKEPKKFLGKELGHDIDGPRVCLGPGPMTSALYFQPKWFLLIMIY